jgi:lipopolysaccharide transport system ATP-binding protein
VRPTTLAEAFTSRLRHPFRRTSKETFWALRDASFDVAPGEVLGVIGRNGAGKSTLLKILSRITEPSSGEVRIRGRVGSLLEVGTGFHPELTGRENVFLNGAILGMERSEVIRQFDSIVEFSGVNRFLDMPVKRYSSGMSVRLAFAIAAHLEPEILLVDEVLAVGDAEFQRRCLGKMSEVASQDARTVLFVSHNMAAIETLCHRCIVLEDGSVQFDGTSQDAVAKYISLLAPSASSAMGEFDLNTQPQRNRWERPILQRLRFVDELLRTSGTLPMGAPLTVVVEVEGLNEISGGFVSVQLYSDLDKRLATFHGHMKPPRRAHARNQREEVVFELETLPLMPGRYWLGLTVWDPNWNRPADRVERAASFEITVANVYGSGHEVRPEEGAIFIDFEWELRPVESPRREVGDVHAIEVPPRIRARAPHSEA